MSKKAKTTAAAEELYDNSKDPVYRIEPGRQPDFEEEGHKFFWFPDELLGRVLISRTSSDLTHVEGPDRWEARNNAESFETSEWCFGMTPEKAVKLLYTRLKERMEETLGVNDDKKDP